MSNAPDDVSMELHMALATAVGLEGFAARAAVDQALFDAIPVALAMFDGTPRLRMCNARYRAVAGFHGPIGTPADLQEAFPNARVDLSPTVEQVRALGIARTIRIPCASVEGPRVVEATFAPIHGTGSSRGVAIVATDVTEREELRGHLASSVAQLSAIFDVIPESVRVFDADGDILRSNALALQEHGEIAPRTLRELWTRERPRTLDHTHVPLDQHPASRALRGESIRDETLAVNRPAGEAIIEVNGNPLRDPSGSVKGAVIVVRDVTDRVRLSQELEEQVRVGTALYAHVATEAERFEKMADERSGELLRFQEAHARDRRLAAVGQLAAGVMHDVNNALNPIMSAAYLLGLNADNPDTVRDYARRIQKAAETGAATAARVGRFIRQEPLSGGREQRFDLGTVVAEAIELTRPTWDRRPESSRIIVEADLNDGITLEGIAGEVREAMLNLVANALDAMKAGGTLTISARVVDGEAWLSVRDTGTGMTEDVRERAFEPFFSTKGTAGSGLGLSEVYGIMKRHRGRAELISTPGIETTVRLRFPLAGPAPAPRPAVLRRRVVRRILLVEDQDDARWLVRELLETEGHRVTVAADLASARALLNAPDGAARFDVVVSDVFLPDGNGWELVAEIRTRFPHLRIGVVTGWELAPPRSVTADFTLRKPLAARELLECVAG